MKHGILVGDLACIFLSALGRDRFSAWEGSHWNGVTVKGYLQPTALLSARSALVLYSEKAAQEEEIRLGHLSVRFAMQLNAFESHQDNAPTSMRLPIDRKQCPTTPG